MTWLADNGIALTALAVSLTTAGVNVSTWVRTRHRVSVSAHTQTTAVAVPGGPGTANHRLVKVVVRTHGRAVSIESVGFALEQPGDPPLYPTMATPPPEALSGLWEPMPGFLSTPVMLADGESRSWVCQVGVPPYVYTDWQAFAMRAEVVLSTGKTVRSSVFWHAPSPAGGHILYGNDEATE